jgi:hypothetical protein
MVPRPNCVRCARPSLEIAHRGKRRAEPQLANLGIGSESPRTRRVLVAGVSSFPQNHRGAVGNRQFLLNCAAFARGRMNSWAGPLLPPCLVWAPSLVLLISPQYFCPSMCVGHRMSGGVAPVRSRGWIPATPPLDLV